MLTTGLSATLLAALLAQAEPAPAEPGPAESAPAQTAPPQQGPAEPAPAEPAPSPTAAAEPPAPPANTMGVLARFAYRVGAEGTSPGPAAGFSLGVSFQRRYLAVDRLHLSVGGEFFHDSFRQDVQGVEPISPVIEAPPDAQRVVSQTSFALMQNAAIAADPITVWVGGGGGLTVASFTTPEAELRPGSLTAFQPMVRGAVGLDVAIGPHMAIGVRADYTHPFTKPTLTLANDGRTVSPFGALFDAGAAFLYRF
jgi:hypothetical protein